MNASMWRALRLLAGRPVLILGAAAALAVMAEASSIGLLALSGWYVASCYLFGAGRLPGFSYLGPSGGVRALAISRIATRYAQNLVGHHATLAWLSRLRTRLFREVADAPPDRLRRLGTGQILDRAMSDADAVDRVLLRAVIPVLLATTTIALAVLAVASVNGSAALALAAGAAVTAAVVIRAPHRDGAAEARGSARGRVVDSIEAWEELVCLGATNALRSAALQALHQVAIVDDQREHAKARAHTAAELVVAATIVATLGAAHLTGRTLSLPTATLLALLVVGALETVATLPDACDSWRTAAEAAARLDLLAAPDGISRNGTETLQTGPVVAVRDLPLAPYAPDYPAVGRSTDLDAATFTVVRGRSGSGKTTLLRSLAGDLNVTDGAVLISGRSPRSYRPGQIVLLAHDDHVFAGTVADNMRIADPSLSDARIAQLLDSMLLARYDVSPETVLGDGGRALSGGEQRRLCLARAVAATPRLLLLDEPTEGVDKPTARAVLRAVRMLLPHTTIVAAVHDRDLDVIVDVANQLVDLDNGAVIRPMHVA